jgi:uncharacterized protein (TIGR03000 family)
VTTTIAPVRTLTTPAGAATLTTAPPSVTPAVPGSRALATTYPPGTPEVAGEVTSSGGSARVIVRVPENARLEFEGVAVAETGRVRKFTTPPMTPGQVYHYDIRATWDDNGQQVVRDRRVRIAAGDRVDVDFLTPTTEEERALHVKPTLEVPTTPPLKPTLPPRRP